ncbi:hypothetical protein M5689_013739 [Euphorbia peplus]|nr:hypothetical protein M5689_013739 [Euphorbia peplus]
MAVVCSSSFMAMRMPNLPPASNHKKTLFIKSALRRERSRSSSGGGAQINTSVSTPTGLRLRSLFEFVLELISPATINMVEDTTNNNNKSQPDGEHAAVSIFDSTPN